MMPQVRADIAVACVIALSLLSQCCSRRAAPPCGCVPLESAVRGLERVNARDWRQIDRSALETDWPQAVPCEQGNRKGLEGASEQIARCCEECELCGGALMDGGSTQAGLYRVDLWLCPRQLESQRAALRALTKAAMTAAPSPQSASMDQTVRVIRSEVERSAGNDIMLWFTYVTTCLPEDRSCHTRELDQLWPRLRSVADRQQVTAITISAESCVGSSVSIRLDRAADGHWQGGALWNPGKK